MKAMHSLIETSTPFLEQLEDRIAPAAAVATFVDVDGDTVTVTANKGTSAQLQTLVDAAVNTMTHQMETLTIDSSYQGASIKIAVSTKASTGDGLVNVWNVNAGGVDLKSVEVGGDLAKLTAGDGNYANGSVATIKVQSIGVNGGAAAKDWHLLGGTSTFWVGGNVNGAKLFWENPTAGGNITIGSLVVGGSLIGGSADNTGIIKVRGGDDSAGTAGIAKITSLTIGGSLTGTNYNQTGAVIVGDESMVDAYKGFIGKATVGGSLLGFNAKSHTGSLLAFSGGIGDVKVGGLLDGGGLRSGSIYAYQGTLGAISVGQSIEGGNGQYSGSIYAGFDIKSASVGGSVEGGSGSSSGSIISEFAKIGDVSVGSYLEGGSTIYAGSINGETGLGKVTIGGSVWGGSASNTGSIFTASTGSAKIGDVTIKGSVFGGSTFSTGIISSDYLGKVSIAGSLTAGTGTGSGSIFAAKNLVSVFIGQDIEGGASGSYSGAIHVFGSGANITSITVGHDLIGDAGTYSGSIIIDNGNVKTLSVGGDLIGSSGGYSGAIKVNGNLTTLSIGGSLLGGSNDYSGHVEIGNAKTVTIGGGLLGGSDNYTGNLTFVTVDALSLGTIDINGSSLWGNSGLSSAQIAGTKVSKLFIAGNILGGSSSFSGSLAIDTIGTAVIGGNLYGGSASDTGYIAATNLTGKLTINGNIQGGNNNSSNSGWVNILNDAKSIDLKGSLIGGNATAALSNEGSIIVGGKLSSLVIGQNIVGGTVTNATNQLNLGAVRAGIIGTMVVNGDVTGTGSQYVAITAQGDITKTKGSNLAIQSLTIKGTASYVNILGGYNTYQSTLNGVGGANGGSAQLGSITVYGDFLSSSIATGVNNQDTAKDHWADGTNTLLSKPTDSTIVASIAKIVLKGAVFASVQNGVAAQQIKSLQIAGFNLPVGTGAQYFQASDGNFYVQQVVA